MMTGGCPATLMVAVGAWTLLAGAPCEAEEVRTRLPNGVTVLVNENPAAPLVAVSLFVRVGARWEKEEEAGVTNLLQQLLVKGTANRSALEIALAAEAIGGAIGASSDADFSQVEGTALARHWRALLELMADVALRPSLPPAELEGERRLILSAIRTRQDQPHALALDTLLARVYGGHPYGRPPLGSPVTLARLDRAALRAHHERYYRAERMILSVSGDVSRDDLVRQAALLFNDASPGDGGAHAMPPAVPTWPGRVSVARPSAQTQVVMGFLAASVANPDYAPLKVLATALGGGTGGRLFTELRDKQGLAYSTNAQYPSRAGPSYVLTQMGTAPVNAVRAEEAMRREIERIRDEGVSEQEVDRARSYLLGQFTLDRRTNARLAWYAGFFESIGVGYDFARSYVRAVEAVSVGDVRRVARAYLRSPAAVSVGPSAR